MAAIGTISLTIRLRRLRKALKRGMAMDEYDMNLIARIRFGIVYACLFGFAILLLCGSRIWYLLTGTK